MIEEITRIDEKKPETRGRKPINDDGSKRKGRYIRCLHCSKSFYYDHTNPQCKPSPKKKKCMKKTDSDLDMDMEIGDEDVENEEEDEQAIIDQFMSLPPSGN